MSEYDVKQRLEFAPDCFEQHKNIAKALDALNIVSLTAEELDVFDGMLPLPGIDFVLKSFGRFRHFCISASNAGNRIRIEPSVALYLRSVNYKPNQRIAIIIYHNGEVYVKDLPLVGAYLRKKDFDPEKQPGFKKVRYFYMNIYDEENQIQYLTNIKDLILSQYIDTYKPGDILEKTILQKQLEIFKRTSMRR